MRDATLSLAIVIPALNEEDAIGNIIQRCIDAREHIMQTAGLRNVYITVVSDGSTDRTVEIARSFADIRVIVFEVNQGYGAAIKAGWRESESELLSFLDADGTCDPRYFAEMSRLAIEENADVVLGSRLGPGSKMPRIRRLGNRVYAFLLGILCGRHVTDTASGMRVVSRRALKHLYPLPDGLHFTPSMSARALLNDLKVIEIPMSYEERLGRSKLSVFHDGIRFLKTIYEGVLCYRPETLFLVGFVICCLGIFLLAAYPTEFYLQNRSIEEWMIYRFVVCYLLGSIALTLLLASTLTTKLAEFGPRRISARSFWPVLASNILSGRIPIVAACLLLLVSIALVWPGIVEYASSGGVTLHWSRVIAGSFGIFSSFQLVLFTLLMQIAGVWQTQSAKNAS